MVALIKKDEMDKLYTSKNPLVRYIHNKRLDVVIKEIPKKQEIKILDAGCGEGHLLERMNKLFNVKFYGADITEIALESAKKRVNGIKFSLQNLENLNYEDDFFDVITCTEVIEHAENYKEVLKELKRILKKNGLLIISFPNEFLWTICRFFLGRKPIKEPEHIHSLSPKMLIKEINFKVKKRINIPFRLPYFLALTRILVFIK